MRSRVALIPARGGSKRLPRKNIIDFLGKPIIAYTIEAALKSNLFEKVVVSTEDLEIGKISEKYGAEISWRPSNLSTDIASVVDVCIDFINQEKKQSNSFDVLTVLYATAPMRNAHDIQAVVNLLSDDCHFALAVSPFAMHQGMRWNGGKVSPVFPEYINLRTSDVETFCIDNGSTYAVHVLPFLHQKKFYGDSLRAYLMPSERSIDIDTPTDLTLALYRAKECL